MKPKAAFRTWLFSPAHRPERVQKALQLPADAVLLDLEDGVPPSERPLARETVSATLNAQPVSDRCWVRVQHPQAPDLAEDLSAAVRPGLAGLCLPKVREAAEVAALCTRLEKHEEGARLPLGSVKLLVLLETALGVVNAAQIAAASPRLAGLMLGTEDLAAELGLWSVSPSEEFLYARSVVALAAASRGLEAVDRVYTHFQDQEGLLHDAARARSLGFSGKAIIHPAQIDVVNTVFTPTEAEVRAAQAVVRAAEAAGGGAFAVGGAMADEPVVARARRLLATHHREAEQDQP
jgi:citrate lyase subunit beta/citryl-CoA lyase